MGWSAVAWAWGVVMPVYALVVLTRGFHRLLSRWLGGRDGEDPA